MYLYKFGGDHMDNKANGKHLLIEIFKLFKSRPNPSGSRGLDPNFSSKEKFIHFITNNDKQSLGNNSSINFNNDYLPLSITEQLDNLLQNPNTYNEIIEAKNYIFDTAFNKTLINLLLPQEDYSYLVMHNKENLEFIPYDKDQQKFLYSYLQINKDAFSTGDILYYLIYFFLHKKNPPAISNRIDLISFDNSILSMYGARADSAVRAIISMATKTNCNNIYAMYEYADMLYYGTTHGVNQNFTKALEYYRKAAGIIQTENNDIHNSISGHPLAYWSLAYIYFNYKKAGTKLENAYIEELEKLTYDKRVEKAITYAQYSLVNNDCASAYNILGNISYEADESTQKKFGLKPAIKYYEIAANKGYSYAYNNLAKCYAEKIILNSTSPKITEWLNEYIKNLGKSSELNDNYASNTLGRFYMEGTLRTRIEGKEKSLDIKDWIISTHFNTKNNYENISFKDIQMIKDISTKYYRKAFQYILDENSAWAIYNMLTNYMNEFDKTFSTTEERNAILNQVGSLGCKAVNDKIIANKASFDYDHGIELIEKNPILKSMA